MTGTVSFGRYPSTWIESAVQNHLTFSFLLKNDPMTCLIFLSYCIRFLCFLDRGGRGRRSKVENTVFCGILHLPDQGKPPTNLKLDSDSGTSSTISWNFIIHSSLSLTLSSILRKSELVLSAPFPKIPSSARIPREDYEPSLVDNILYPLINEGSTLTHLSAASLNSGRLSIFP